MVNEHEIALPESREPSDNGDNDVSPADSSVPQDKGEPTVPEPSGSGDNTDNTSLEGSPESPVLAEAESPVLVKAESIVLVPQESESRERDGKLMVPKGNPKSQTETGSAVSTPHESGDGTDLEAREGNTGRESQVDGESTVSEPQESRDDATGTVSDLGEDSSQEEVEESSNSTQAKRTLISSKVRVCVHQLDMCSICAYPFTFL